MDEAYHTRAARIFPYIQVETIKVVTIIIRSSESEKKKQTKNLT